MSTDTTTEQATGKSAMNKAFWRVLPLIGLAYLFAYMDRVNVSFAAASMNGDLAFSATIYGLGGGLFFLGYALFEIPSNLMLVRFGARKWIARIMITWGLLSAAMMFVETPMQFYVLRFLLGVAEAGFYPGVIFYFAGWFPPCHRSRAVSRFFVFSPLASVAMGAMSGWLLGLDGNAGLHGWQWLFLVQGLPTVLVGLLVLKCLPDSPTTVTWLTQQEKDWIHTELVREQARFAVPSVTSSGWAEVLHVRELAIGAAAINTISQIGAFVAPYGWGMAKDATGSFQPALITLAFIALIIAALLMLLRRQVSGRAAQPATATA